MGSYYSLCFHLMSHGQLSVSAYRHPYLPSQVSLVDDIWYPYVFCSYGLWSAFARRFLPFQVQGKHEEQILVP